MLGIFHRACGHPPEELKSPSMKKPEKVPEETMREFMARHPRNSLSLTFGKSAALAYHVREEEEEDEEKDKPPRNFSLCKQRRIREVQLCGVDDIYCLFVGSLNNLCSLNREYGLTSSNEAMLVIEAYRTLRDRGPYPADQVVKEFDGTFAFLIYDSNHATLFVALGSDGGVKLYWGVGADGSLVFCDDIQVIRAACANSFAPFPPGFMFHSEGGLMSFEHPMHKIRAMPRTDSQGVVCGANFKVDLYQRINSLPRNGSAANWTEWDSHS